VRPACSSNIPRTLRKSPPSSATDSARRGVRRARSSRVRKLSRDTRASGSRATASIKLPRCSIIRLMVSSSKRSVLYSTKQSRPSGISSRTSERSNSEVTFWMLMPLTLRPSRPRPAPGAEFKDSKVGACEVRKMKFT
jgi:hypothetical protein